MRMEVRVSRLPSDRVCHSLRCHGEQRGRKKERKKEEGEKRKKRWKQGKEKKQKQEQEQRRKRKKRMEMTLRSTRMGGEWCEGRLTM